MTRNQIPARVRLEPPPADERLAILRVDRPPVNALDQDMWDAFSEVAATLHESATIRAVVITGGERHFGVGADIKELTGLTAAEFDQRNRVLQSAFHGLATAPQVTIAAVHGYALGGGCELALAADFRVAGRGTVLALPEITLGIMPGSGGTQRLSRIVGLARAKDIILSGRFVAADEALRIGLVDQLVEDADVFATAVERGLAYARGPLALRYAKQAVELGAALPIEAGLSLEADLITTCFATEDARNGLRSFAEDGPGKAVFRGR